MYVPAAGGMRICCQGCCRGQYGNASECLCHTSVRQWEDCPSTGCHGVTHPQWLDSSRRTACHIVAHHNPDAEAISAAIPFLVAEGASVNGVYAVNQATALHYAATNPNADAAVAAILALVAAHADVHAKTWSGAQPLVSLWLDWNEGTAHNIAGHPVP